MTPHSPFKFTTDRSDNPEVPWVVKVIEVSNSTIEPLAGFTSEAAARKHEAALRTAFNNVWVVIQPNHWTVIDSINKSLLSNTHQ